MSLDWSIEKVENWKELADDQQERGGDVLEPLDRLGALVDEHDVDQPEAEEGEPQREVG